MREINSTTAFEERTNAMWGENGHVTHIAIVLIPHTQRTMAPETPHEKAAVSEGFCPKCGDKLGGDNGLFCVRDQFWWEPPRL